ncbi:MAG: UDP-N-acetylglucosamine 1-carboxyvinyltransferase, partial [Bacteroidaceae bacterium]|nr:UDP-N-acetylglucosamine 1-carboxyvinyltransferase [Bacteroidaceae bacterium]
MASFIIEGGHRLQGEITPQGAKNEALQVICATLLTHEEVTIKNIPDIADVNNLIHLLQDMGVETTRIAPGTYTFKAENINLGYLESQEYLERCSSLRGSVLLIGPLVARFGKAILSKPGGDKIGRRRLDTHFLGIRKLGATFCYDNAQGLFRINAS